MRWSTTRPASAASAAALHALPDSFHRLNDGDEIKIGGRMWRVVVGSGHSPEHACLYCPELKLMISGDQVLPKISSNVSVFPTEPDGDPLTDWLTSLARIKTKIPDDVLVLPAHNDPFHGLHARHRPPDRRARARAGAAAHADRRAASGWSTSSTCCSGGPSTRTCWGWRPARASPISTA